MSLYGLIIGISILIGSEYFTRHNNIVPKKLESWFVILGVVVSILGARLYHVIDSWDYYSQHIWQIPNTRAGGLGIYGALITGFLYIYLFSHYHHISFLKLLNLISPVIPLCQAIGRLGNYFNHEIPYWWLESILNLVLFTILQFYPKNTFAKYLIGYGLIRFVFEFFRSDTWVIGSTKIGQLIGIIFMVIGSAILYVNKKQAHQLS